jgi:mycofactocin system transcriptional regulator
MDASSPSHDRLGRPQLTSKAEIERVALDRFVERGFTETTVDDIASVAGIARRTFFRYFASKNDVVWGDFDSLLGGLNEWLTDAPTATPMWEAIRDAVTRFNALAPEAAAAHRRRMTLILHVPALQAHSTLRYAEWRAIIARFAARRTGESADAFGPQLVGHVSLAIAVTAYEQWLADDTSDLRAILLAAFGAVDVRTP